MNELVNRLISYLEQQKVVRHTTSEVALPGTPEQQIESIFVGGLFFLEKFSRIIESTVIDRRLGRGSMFVNLHSFANVLVNERRERFQRLDQLDNRTFVYGVDDPQPWPFTRIRPVRLSSRDSLRRSWFVVFDGPEISYALVAMGRVVSAESPHKIQYKGFWTTRPSVTHSVRDYLLRVVNAQYGVKDSDLPG